MRLSRRKLLTLAGGALATQQFPVLAQSKKSLKIGVIMPTRTGIPPVSSTTISVGGDLARMGAILAQDDLAEQAERQGTRLYALLASAPTTEVAVRAAERLVDLDKAFALVGGFGEDQAQAIAEVAKRRKVPFFNIDNPSDGLRNTCSRYVFHVQASAAMYLDVLSEWMARQKMQRVFLLYGKTPEGQALHARAKKALARQKGLVEAGSAGVIKEQADYGREIEAIRKAKSSVALVLLDGVDFTNFMGQYEILGLDVPVVGYPDPLTQTRIFDTSLRQIAPKSGLGFRANLWDTTLKTAGADKLSARFSGRFGEPMDAPAWAAYHSVKMLFESAIAVGTDANKLIAHLENPRTSFDVAKGTRVSFRPWDHQLRQPLYVVKPDASVQARLELNIQVALLKVAATLPSGNANVQSLDRYGDGPAGRKCV